MPSVDFCLVNNDSLHVFLEGIYKSLYLLLSGDCRLILCQGSREGYLGFDQCAFGEEAIVVIESKNSSTLVPELGSFVQHSEAGLTYDR